MALGDDILLLRRLDFFEAFDTEPLRLMLFAAERRSLEPGEALFSRGDLSSGGFVVQTGLISLKPDLEQSEEILIHAGGLIGELALLVPSARPVYATAVEPSQLIVLPHELIQRLLSEYPVIAKDLRDRLMSRLVAFQADLAQVGLSFGPGTEDYDTPPNVTVTGT